ncbi:DoxX family protein [Parapedobacter deserti]|uniref:DoxX family protein n=1 Tax=Parapedobacter deserti TaxID=1912957 RepID=A0ABV7JLV8_9SPHI
MKQKLFGVRNDWTGVVLRLTLGIVMLPHGAQKMLGWFGGPGFQKEMLHLTEDVQLPWLISLLVILIEFFGSICILAGLASRLWAIAFFILFTGIIFSSHIEFGFFMNWFGNQSGEGIEYHLLVLGICIAVFLNGSGKFALDKMLSVK